MPNVMGREFPYTPQGMAEAQQYSQSLGMRDGGSMGFRPVGYANGGAAGSEVPAEVQFIFDGLVAATRGSVQDVVNYIAANRPGLDAMMSMLPPRQADFVRNTISSVAPAQAPQEQAGNVGRLAAELGGATGAMGAMSPMGRLGGGFGDPRLSDQDVESLRAMNLPMAPVERDLQQRQQGGSGAGYSQERMPNREINDFVREQMAPVSQMPPPNMNRGGYMNRGGIMSLRRM